LARYYENVMILKKIMSIMDKLFLYDTTSTLYN